jgi:hypothetical protein
MKGIQITPKGRMLLTIQPPGMAAHSEKEFADFLQQRLGPLMLRLGITSDIVPMITEHDQLGVTLDVTPQEARAINAALLN